MSIKSRQSIARVRQETHTEEKLEGWLEGFRAKLKSGVLLMENISITLTMPAYKLVALEAKRL
jgi:hypothetical protein